MLLPGGIFLFDMKTEAFYKRLGDLTFTDEVVSHLAKEGFDPVYGARPLRRAMQRQIEDSLSLRLLEGTISRGDKVEAVLEDGKVEYKKKTTENN